MGVQAEVQVARVLLQEACLAVLEVAVVLHQAVAPGAPSWVAVGASLEGGQATAVVAAVACRQVEASFAVALVAVLEVACPRGVA